MNLTGQSVYVKGDGNRRARQPNASERKLWARIRDEIGCIISNWLCFGGYQIHHCGTKRGGRKNHKKVLGLCWNHHQGPDGIDGKVITPAKWEALNGTEEFLMEKQRGILHANN